MASRALRSKKQLDCEGLNESEIHELPAAQPLFSDSFAEDISGEEITIGNSQSSGMQEKGKAFVGKTTTAGISTVSAKNIIDNVASQNPPADLLSIIWQAIQEDRAERKRDKQESKRIRL
jgi:hypothetical protein